MRRMTYYPTDAVEAFRKAMLARDHAALDMLCAFQLSFGHANGTIQRGRVH